VRWPEMALKDHGRRTDDPTRGQQRRRWRAGPPVRHLAQAGGGCPSPQGGRQGAGVPA